MRVLLAVLVLVLAVSAFAETEHTGESGRSRLVSSMVSAALKGAAFKIKKNKSAAQPFHFTAVAGNNEVVLSSESYSDLDGARNGVESVIAHAGLRQNIKPGTAKDGKPYWTVQADNGKTIGVSETYSSNAAAAKGADALHAIVVDVTNSIAKYIPVTPGKEKGESSKKESAQKSAANKPLSNNSRQSGKSRFAEVLKPSESSARKAKVESARRESTKGHKVKAGHFEIKKTSKGFHYIIKGANGEIVASSEVYPAKEAVYKGVGAALRACGVKENLNVEKSEAASKGFFVNCKAENNQKLFTTEIYTKAATGEDAVSILQNAVRATIGRYVKIIPVQETKSESGSKAESTSPRKLESTVSKILGKK